MSCKMSFLTLLRMIDVAARNLISVEQNQNEKLKFICVITLILSII